MKMNPFNVLWALTELLKTHPGSYKAPITNEEEELAFYLNGEVSANSAELFSHFV